jgi:hypothetical protein
MVESSYKYGKKRREKKRWRWAILVFVLLLLIIAGLIGYDVYKGRSTQQTGAPKISQLVVDGGPKIKIDEPTFSLVLPGDWKEMGRVNNEVERSITWQATMAKEDNRFMTIYIDKIPRTKSFNRLLPLEAVGASLRHGSVSDNCAAFTEGGSFDASVAAKARDTQAKWEEVTFICDLPKVFDDVVGTSSLEGINIVGITGEKSGKHNYFFTYTDHNTRANYEIFSTIIESFKAK